MTRLDELDVLAVDCQATAASPAGRLIELGWAHVGGQDPQAHARLVRLPDGERVPPAVARVTGISDDMTRAGVPVRVAWQELSRCAAAFAQQPPPAIAHFARFETPFLQSLAGGTLPFDLVCTHEIARRVLPDLPRRSLRALTGYFGRAVGALRRSADHVEATGFIWRELVRLLEAESVATWDDLRAWLRTPGGSARPRRRIWPMPREVRLALPDAPGLYRMLRTSGDVLYVGKASSLHHRVNSYFRKQHGIHERTLEMLSQARSLSFEITATALEAALLEADEIKRQRPPYNIALTDEARDIWFTPLDLSERSPRPSGDCPLGPFTSTETLDQFAALARGSRAALGTGRWAPDASTFEAGLLRLNAAHAGASRAGGSAHARLLRLGTRLWHQGRRDRDADRDDASRLDGSDRRWTPEIVQLSLEWLVIRAALAQRRARWLTRMVEASVAWCEPGAVRGRLLVVEAGEIAVRTDVEAGSPPPIPPGYLRSTRERRDTFTVARFDRLRVLTTELKRLVAEGAPVAVRFGEDAALADVRLARALSWI